MLLSRDSGPEGEADRVVASIGIEPEFLSHFPDVRSALQGHDLATVQHSGELGDLQIWNICSTANGEYSDCALDWMHSQGFGNGLFVRHNTVSGLRTAMFLLRQEEAQGFSEAQLALLVNLAPVAANVVEMAETTYQLIRLSDLSQTALNRIGHGVLFLAGDGSVLGANTMGKDILSEADGLHAGVSGLHASSQADTMRMRQALAPHAEPQDDIIKFLTIARPSGRANLQLAMTPVVPSMGSEKNGRDHVVIVADPDEQTSIDVTALMKLLGLTLAEARLLAGLTQGRPLQEQAEELGIKISTARTYVARMFSKTETKRQPELIGLALRSLASLTHT